MERGLLASPTEDVRSDAYLMLWSARQITRIGAELQEKLFSFSRDRLDQQQRRASLEALIWLTVFVAGVAVVAGGVFIVLSRVVQPLGELRRSMLALADGQLDAPLPEHSRRDEIGEMADTLRVFKVNAIRRERLQAERLSLLEKLQGAYRQLEVDLKAASAVQLALLPAPARIGGVTFSGQLRPSHFISGDSYDVLRQPNGSVHFFLADVAGHGAAAALVSVAARYTMTEAILRRSAGQSLAETVSGLNEDWPEHLTYFTWCLANCALRRGKGSLSRQAIHRPSSCAAQGCRASWNRRTADWGDCKSSFEEIAFTFEWAIGCWSTRMA
jgi:HAMP domain-containing protein